MQRAARFVRIPVVLAAVAAVGLLAGQTRRSPGAQSVETRITIEGLPLPPRPHDFSAAKRELRRMTDGSLRRDVYCGCRFDERGSVMLDDCEAARPYLPVETHAARADHIEWDHVLPASYLYHDRPCFTDRPPRTDARRFCRQEDPAFRMAEGDMHNLLPAVGQINALRENYPFAEIEGETHIAGCDFEVFERTVEPREAVRGDLARAMLYAAATYGVALPPSQVALLQRWHAADRPSDAERLRNDAIERVQGNRNPYVDGLR